MPSFKPIVVVPLFIVFALGCTALTTLLTDTKDKIEVLIGKEGAGVYTVSVTKDGTVLWSESRRCDVGPDGKLAGCHVVQ